MRQTILIVTCDKCGLRKSFETLNVNANGPIVMTIDPVAMLKRRGWVSNSLGLRQIDICDVCCKTDD